MPTPMQQFQPDQILVGTLQAQEWNVVLGALGEIPYKFAAPVIDKLRGSLMSPELERAIPRTPRPANGDARDAPWVPDAQVP